MGEAAVIRPAAPATILWLLTLGAVVLAAVPMLLCDPTPLEGWPGHLARVEILSGLTRGAPFWSQFYHLNTFFLPNIALDVSILGLHAIGLPIHAGAQVVLLATYVLFVLGGIWLSRAFGATEMAKPLLLAMLFYNGALMGGFVNYMIALGMMACVLAAWIEADGGMWRQFAIAVLGSILVFFAHLIAAVTLIFLIGLIALFDLVRERRFTWRAIAARASPAAAAATIGVMLALSPTTADSPGGGTIYYAGEGSVVGIVKAKFVMFFHALLDGSGIVGAAIFVFGLTITAVLLFPRVRMSGKALFISFGMLGLVLVSPNGIGVGYGLDYRLVVPLVMVVICGLRFHWNTSRAHWLVACVLLATLVARTGSFASDSLRDRETFSAFRAFAKTIPPDSVLLTGIGRTREQIAWGDFWAPPLEYLGTEAVANGTFVPTVFAFASQQPIAINAPFSEWHKFAEYGSPSDAAASYRRVQQICQDWAALGHSGKVLMLLVYLSVASEERLPKDLVIGSGPGFRVVDVCAWR